MTIIVRIDWPNFVFDHGHDLDVSVVDIVKHHINIENAVIAMAYDALETFLDEHYPGQEADFEPSEIRAIGVDWVEITFLGQTESVVNGWFLIDEDGEEVEDD